MDTDAREWRKLLYVKQKFPDNSVPSSFLKDLNKNVNSKFYSLNEVLVSSLVYTQQINCVVIFISVYMLLHDEPRNSIKYTVSYTIAALTFFLYTGLILLSNSHEVVDYLRRGFIFIISGVAFSPILKTLTETVSTDTIYTMSTIMLIIHLFFFDYGVSVAIVSRSISLNAAIFAAVCLASRLSSLYHVLALLTFATNVFVLFPVLKSSLPSFINFGADIVLNIFLIGISLVALYCRLPLLFVFLYLISLAIFNLALPYLFYRWQIYKANIYGPWDEAVISSKEKIS